MWDGESGRVMGVGRVWGGTKDDHWGQGFGSKEMNKMNKLSRTRMGC